MIDANSTSERATADLGALSTTGMPLLTDCGTTTSLGMSASAVICRVRSTSPTSSLALELARLRTSRNFSFGVFNIGGSFHAIKNVCPHAGRRLDWAPGKFLVTKDGLLVCAVHGATFELESGVCVAGPCRGEVLRAVAIEVRERKVWLSGDPGVA